MRAAGRTPFFLQQSQAEAVGKRAGHTDDAAAMKAAEVFYRRVAAAGQGDLFIAFMGAAEWCETGFAYQSGGILRWNIGQICLGQTAPEIGNVVRRIQSECGVEPAAEVYRKLIPALRTVGSIAGGNQ